MRVNREYAENNYLTIDERKLLKEIKQKTKPLNEYSIRNAYYSFDTETFK